MTTIKQGPMLGRPPLNEEERLLPYSIRLTRAERAKLIALGGGAAFRRWLQSQRFPKRKQ